MYSCRLQFHGGPWTECNFGVCQTYLPINMGRSPHISCFRLPPAKQYNSHLECRNRLPSTPDQFWQCLHRTLKNSKCTLNRISFNKDILLNRDTHLRDTSVNLKWCPSQEDPKNTPDNSLPKPSNTVNGKTDYVPVSINADSVVWDVGVRVFFSEEPEQDFRIPILRVNNCLIVPVVVVGMRLLLLFVLGGSSCLDLCREGMWGRGIILRGMDVQIVLLIGVVIVVYLSNTVWVNCRLWFKRRGKCSWGKMLWCKEWADRIIIRLSP